MSDLIKKFKNEIKKVNFSPLEMKGFSANPRLALLAGIAIGYKFALKETIVLYNKEIKND